MTKLSVNINKIATLRNARGGNVPDVIQAALDIERFGADGITVHPRPDERHIRFSDVRELKKCLTSELNVEGYPSDSFLSLVFEVLPAQVTLVPDPPDVLTSNAGWDTVTHQDFLKSVISKLQQKGIRTSLFMAPDEHLIRYASKTGTNRIELYTESYARNYTIDAEKAVADYRIASSLALSLKLEINAGHDLNLQNLKFFNQQVPGLCEVSIGHALISDALYFGLENTVQLYKRQLLA